MSTEETQDEKQLDKLESVFTDTKLDMDTSLIYKPVDTNAILIFVFFIHIILILFSWPLLFVFDIFAFYFIFQIIRANTERTYQAISNYNKDIEKLKKQVKELIE